LKIAIVLTVKNEARLLRNNLLYHKAIGVDQAFVYFDNTTDDGQDSIADLNFVKTTTSVQADNYIHLDYLQKFTSQAAEHHTARQCLNTYDALRQCKTLGIDWLISLDADELICTDLKQPSNLKSFFKSIVEEVEVVNFKTLEALQQKEKYQNVFAEEILFKANKQAFYKSINNPFSKLNQQFTWWYGHTMGKAAIRVDKNVIPHNVHRYKRIDGTQPVRVDKGNVLHYHAYDAEDFIKKFTNFEDHPNTFLSGNKVEDLKLLLRDVVNSSDYNRYELENYFKENLMFHEKEINKFKKGRKFVFFKIKPTPLKEITSVQLAFKSIDS
jgi:hypothetical protein